MHSDLKENLLSKTKKEGSNIKVTNVSHIRLDKSQKHSKAFSSCFLSRFTRNKQK